MEPEGSLPHSPANATCPYPKPEQSSPLHFFKIHFIVSSSHLSLGLSSDLFPSQLTSKTPLKTSPVSHTCLMPHPSHSIWFNHLNNIWWALHIIKVLAVQSSELPHYLIPLRPKYLPQHPILEHSQPTFLPHCDRPSFIPTQNRENYSSVYLNLHIFGQQTGWQKILYWITAIIPTLQFSINTELTLTEGCCMKCCM